MAASTSKAKKEKFTAIVYFHGMGEQKRYEEASRLLDGLERFHRSQGNPPWGSKKKDGKQSQDSKTEAKAEVSVVEDKRTVGYIELKYQEKNYRFYEAYWANITAGGIKSTEVALWILKQSKMPIEALLAPWRDMARLKRSVLLENWDVIKERRGDNATEEEEKWLFESYDGFDTPENRKRFPRGSFSNFIELLREKIPDAKDPGGIREKMAVNLAKDWRRKFIGNQIKSLFVLVSMLLAILLVAFAALAFIGAFADFFKQSAMLGWLNNAYKPISEWIGKDAIAYDLPHWYNWIFFLLALAVAFFVPFFLRTYMGDVYFWVTYEESSVKHQKRLEILKTCTDTLRQALHRKKGDPNECERIIIVAHSLGTTIAYESLLELARYNRSLPKDGLLLSRISYFITLASPIDKISYFFENQRSHYHQYLRVVDQIRGDTSLPPFRNKQNKNGIKWLNFWDKADIISGSLQGVGNRTDPNVNVENLQVRSYLFPEPGSAHGAYFENKQILGSIYKIIFGSTDSGMKDGYAQFTLRLTAFLQALLLATPWLITAYLIAARITPVHLLEPWANWPGWAILVSLIITLAILVFFGIGSWLIKHVDKLDL
jgi:hypothetical protein